MKQIDRISILFDSGFTAIIQGRDILNSVKQLERKTWPKERTSR